MNAPLAPAGSSTHQEVVALPRIDAMDLITVSGTSVLEPSSFGLVGFSAPVLPGRKR